MHRLGGVHSERHTCGEDAAHHRQQQALFQIEVFGLDAHFAFFQLACAGDDAHANHRDQHAEQRHLAAFSVNENIKLTIENRGHERTDNQRNTNGDADPHRHAEIAHRQAVVNITDAPHGAEQENGQKRGGVKRSVIGPEVGQQHGADGPGEDQPGDDPAD